MKKSQLLTGMMAAAMVLGLTADGWADVKQIKLYKEAYPDAKARCSGCHASDKPKKEDGAHDLNEYGKKVAAVKAEVDAESYKAAGPVPDAQA